MKALTEWRRGEIVVITSRIRRVGCIGAKVERNEEYPYSSHQTKAKPRSEVDTLRVDHTPPRMKRDGQRPDSNRCLPNVLKRPLGRAVSTTVDLRFVDPLGVQHPAKGHQQFTDE